MINQKTGVGYLTESLITALAQNANRELELIGFYFNFLGKKDTTQLPRVKGLRYIEIRFFPTKILNALRRFGIELPIELFIPKKADLLLFSNFVSLPSLFRTRNIVFVHDTSFEDTPQYAADKNATFLRKFVPISIKRASRVITISNFSRSRIQKLYTPKTAVEVMPVPPKPAEVSDDSVFSTFSIPPNYILFVGTLEPRKNLETLIKSYPKIYEATNCALVVAGGRGWKDEKLQLAIEKLKSKGLPIIMTGYISDEQKTSLYSKTLLYIQPSHYEGFGMPLLEAMACSTAVLCSDIPVFREVAGASAAYFDKDSPDDLAKQAIALLTDQNMRKALQRKSKAYIDTYPSWKDVSQKILQMIQEVTAE